MLMALRCPVSSEVGPGRWTSVHDVVVRDVERGRHQTDGPLLGIDSFWTHATMRTGRLAEFARILALFRDARSLGRRLTIPVDAAGTALGLFGNGDGRPRVRRRLTGRHRWPDCPPPDPQPQSEALRDEDQANGTQQPQTDDTSDDLQLGGGLLSGDRQVER